MKSSELKGALPPQNTTTSTGKKDLSGTPLDSHDENYKSKSKFEQRNCWRKICPSPTLVTLDLHGPTVRVFFDGRNLAMAVV